MKQLVSLSLSLTGSSPSMVLDPPANQHQATNSSANQHQPLRRVSSNQVSKSKDSADMYSKASANGDSSSVNQVTPESSNQKQDSFDSTNQGDGDNKKDITTDVTTHSKVSRVRSSSEDRQPVVYRKQPPAFTRSISDSPKGLYLCLYSFQTQTPSH